MNSHPSIKNIPAETLTKMVENGFNGINCSQIIALYASNPDTAEKLFASDKVKVVVVTDPDPVFANTAGKYHLLFELTGSNGAKRYFDPKGLVNEGNARAFRGLQPGEVTAALEAVFDNTLKQRVIETAKASKGVLTFDEAAFNNSIAAMTRQIRGHIAQPIYKAEPMTKNMQEILAT